MAGRLIRLGWVEQFDLDNMPNKVANMQDVYKGVDFDPTDDHHAPWQSGMTGLGYDSAVTGDLTSLASLWTTDPRWTGKVDVPDRDAGRDRPDDARARARTRRRRREADADAAIADIQKAVDDGIVRAFTGNEYAEDLVSGNVVLAMAWSGDIVVKQAEKETLAWQLPDEGGMLWTDNMLIPKGAAHKYTAELMIDFVLRPGDRGPDRGVGQLRHPGQGRQGGRSQRDRSRARREPADLPARRRARQRPHLQGPVRGRRDLTSTTSSPR